MVSLNPSPSFVSDLHNDARKYSTTTHEKKNVLIYNKGGVVDAPAKPRTLDYVSSMVLVGQGTQKHSASLGHVLPEQVKSGSRPSQFKPSGDTAVDEAEDPTGHFEILVSEAIGDYLEDKLYDSEIKGSYMSHAKDLKRYKGTQAYDQAEAKYRPDKNRFQKDLSLFSSKKTVIIGLEDVLAQLSIEEIKDHNLALPVMQDSLLLGMLYVKLRPHLIEFLEFLSVRFELIVFCRGLELYCAPVLDALESRRRYFAHRIYGTHVLFENQHFSVKYYDFLLTHGRSSKNIVIVDCNVGTYCLNLSNGIPVSPFTGGLDFELVYLAKYLEGLQEVGDVSEVISNSLKKCFANYGLLGWKSRLAGQ